MGIEILIQSLDLASVSWASYLRDASVDFSGQFSAIDYPEEQGAVIRITRNFHPDWVDRRPDFLIIEDLPHAVQYGEYLKYTCRMQGRIIHLMEEYGYLDRVRFMQPKIWQDYFGLFRSKPPEQRAVAEQLGYEPPDMCVEYACDFEHLKGSERAKVRTHLKKLETDYVAAFLIYAWAVGKLKADGTLDDLKGVQKVTR